MQRINGSKVLTLSTAVALTLLVLPVTAANPTMSAQDSDPVKMGWMQGFPPAQSKRITQPDSNFFSFPKLRWSVCNMRQLLPTTNINRAISHYQPLVFSPLANIDELRFTPLNSNQTMT
ncbi:MULTISPECIES: hypothetical protein [Rheinheimera]|uniref:hypothetical protein n=1 Tax=Rheinheimera TaxID=67575 RepID=UPI001FB6A9D9|nr:hypothetical protein [Rheinheimera sp. D18]